MSNHFSMGAINKTTNSYEYPKIANKINKYKCPFCEKDVIFRNGKIKQPHFAHYKSDNPCSYYEKPNETQVHKDAKLLMKALLDNKTKILLSRECYECLLEENAMFEYKITDTDYNENTIATMEYRFNYNNSNRSADVALVENKDIKYIFEICYKNKTKEENRPEPWFEINAEMLINNINSVKNIETNNEIRIECTRDYKCDYCKEVIEYERNRQIEYERNRQIKEIKEKEQKSEKNELLNMSKEDERTIEREKKIKLEKENNERIERELLRKQFDEEQEIKRKQREIERITQSKQREIERITQNEIMEREKEYMRKFLEKDKLCGICNINYCKCDNPNFIKNKYNKTICNSCKKYKCLCVRITDFFKK
jgi:hypothetical protein